ncbi:hypothetical protein MFRU_012g01530 [Monilinia fructicola]|nr:hypothetical protein MFRU_012g01530 [Monilinia fructicola]
MIELPESESAEAMADFSFSSKSPPGGINVGSPRKVASSIEPGLDPDLEIHIVMVAITAHRINGMLSRHDHDFLIDRPHTQKPMNFVQNWLAEVLRSGLRSPKPLLESNIVNMSEAARQIDNQFEFPHL